MNIQKFSTEVAENYAGKNAAFDPATIMVIMEIITNIIQMFKDCKKTPEAAVEEAKAPSRWQRILLNSAVRRQIGRKEFRHDGDKIVSALLKSGGKVTVEDMADMYSEQESMD